MQETTSTAAIAPALPNRPRFGRRTLILAAIALITAGLVLNWGWLTAIGAAPLILSLAPCAVMCGLGLCMMGGNKSCSSKKTQAGEPAGSTEPTSN